MDPKEIDTCLSWGTPDALLDLTSSDIISGTAKIEELSIFSSSGSIIDSLQTPSLSIALETERNLKQGQYLEYKGFLPISTTKQRRSDSAKRLDPNHEEYEIHEEFKCGMTKRFKRGVPIWKMFGWGHPEVVVEEGSMMSEGVGEGTMGLGGMWTLGMEDLMDGVGRRRGEDVDFFLGEWGVRSSLEKGRQQAGEVFLAHR